MLKGAPLQRGAGRGDGEVRVSRHQELARLPSAPSPCLCPASSRSPPMPLPRQIAQRAPLTAFIEAEWARHRGVRRPGARVSTTTPSSTVHLGCRTALASDRLGAGSEYILGAPARRVGLHCARACVREFPTWWRRSPRLPPDGRARQTHSRHLPRPRPHKGRPFRTYIGNPSAIALRGFVAVGLHATLAWPPLITTSNNLAARRSALNDDRLTASSLASRKMQL